MRATPLMHRTAPSPRAGPACVSRIEHIHKKLAAGCRVDALQLARDLEVSPRTVKRDLSLLRDFYQAPIAWDRATCSYRYTSSFGLLTNLRLDVNEALALVLARHTFAAWGGSVLGRTLASALGKISDFAHTVVSVPREDLAEILFHPQAESDSEYRFFAVLIEHIRQRNELILRYHKPGARKNETRTIHPLHLAYLDHGWMLIAQDLERGAWRNFLLTRIDSLAPTGRHFTPPPRGKIVRHLLGSVGRFTGDEEIEVRLKFDAIAAPYIRERPWHTSQHIESNSDGSIEVTLRLNNLIDVQRRVLANGRHVEVLSPPELRANLAADIAALAQTYASEIHALKKKNQSTSRRSKFSGRSSFVTRPR